MRFTYILLIFCVLFSSLANAERMCCLDLSKSQTFEVGEMPCHEMGEMDRMADMDLGAERETVSELNISSSQCECQNCFQYSSVAYHATADIPFYFNYLVSSSDDFKSLERPAIYHPPKQFS